MNLDNFKKSALRAELFLKQKGLEVPHTALLEALARYEGFRNFKAMAGASGEQPDAKVQKVAVPGISVLPQGMRLRIFVRTHACDDHAPSGMPDFAFFDFDNAGLQKLQQLCDESTARRVDLDGDLFPSELVGGDWRISFRECTVSGGEFWVSGTEKHSGCKVESSPVRLAGLLKVAQRAVEFNAPAVLWGTYEDGKEDFVQELLDADDGAEWSCETLRLLYESGTLNSSLAADDVLYA